jgi:phosphatidylglycerophosphate synthase
MSDPIREHRSVLAAAEKRLLIAIAGRLPRAVTSDHLTLLALASMGVAGLAYALAARDRGWLWLAIAALFLNWFGDSLDGTLARVRRLERPRYGFYIDHVVDIVGITLLLAGLACSGFMTPVIGLALLVAYLLVAGEVFLAASVHGLFRMSFAGVGPTELRIVLAIGTFALRHDPRIRLGALGSLAMFDVGGAMAIAGLAVALAVSVSRNARTLARLEPRLSVHPRRGTPPQLEPGR